ncbi:hypothetical protein CK203_089580 [Vitis vinifera]|uniref:Uncharacterized protein n=1 Tax=Vitis vinifera TaxID=29760 RepID=A0A438FBJ6_VITVI|nr:hypothetical protein CK203_089580 [Vitis vinifera]
MSISNGVLLPFILLLVSTSVFSPKPTVFGSSVPEQSFNRIDPLHHFKHYRGGYDIRNKHYWASAVFTGVHGYATAGVWVLCGLGFGIFMVVRSLCCSSPTIIKHSNSYYLFTFFLVLLLTSLAIVAASIALAANQRSFHRMRKMKEAIVGVGGDAHKTIREVSKTMEQMQNILLPYDPTTSARLNLTAHQLGRESKTIQDFVNKDGDEIELAIKTSYLVHLGVLALNLVLLVAALAYLHDPDKHVAKTNLIRLMDCCFGSVLLLLHWHPGFIMIIFFCWILTTLCWVLTGIDYFLHTLGDDTCSALEDFDQSPHNNSLNSMLPCGGSSNSNKALVEISYTVHNFIDELNSKVKELHELLQVLEKFTCYNEYSNGTCKGVGKFLPEDTYDKAWAYSDSIQDLLNIFPDLQSLTTCSFVRNAFSEVVAHQCSPFKERGRCFSMCSIIPNPTQENHRTPRSEEIYT